MQQSEEGSRADGDDDPERERSARPERLVQHEAGEIPEERGHEHDALDPDVDDAGAFTEHAA